MARCSPAEVGPYGSRNLVTVKARSRSGTTTSRLRDVEEAIRAELQTSRAVQAGGIYGNALRCQRPDRNECRHEQKRQGDEGETNQFHTFLHKISWPDWLNSDTGRSAFPTFFVGATSWGVCQSLSIPSVSHPSLSLLTDWNQILTVSPIDFRFRKTKIE